VLCSLAEGNSLGFDEAYRHVGDAALVTQVGDSAFAVKTLVLLRAAVISSNNPKSTSGRH